MASIYPKIQTDPNGSFANSSIRRTKDIVSRGPLPAKISDDIQPVLLGPSAGISNGSLDYATFQDPFDPNFKGVVEISPLRWIMLSCLVAILMLASFDVFNLIPWTNVLESRYNLSPVTTISMTAGMVIATQVLFSLPAPLLANMLGLKSVISFSAASLFVGSGIKAAAVGSRIVSYIWVGQLFCTLPMVLLPIASQMLAACWFPESEWPFVALVTSTATTAGTALPFVYGILAYSSTDVLMLLHWTAFSSLVVPFFVTLAFVFAREPASLSPVWRNEPFHWRYLESRQFWDAIRSTLQKHDMVITSVACGLVYGVFWSVLFSLSPVAASEGISFKASLAVGAIILPVSLLSPRAIMLVLSKLQLLSVTIGAVILACGLGLGLFVFSVYNLELAPVCFSIMACMGAVVLFLLAPSLPWLSQEHASVTCYPVSPAVSESISNAIVASLGMLVPIMSVATGGRAVMFLSKGVENVQSTIWVWFSMCIVSAVVMAVFVRDAVTENVSESKPFLLRHILDRLRKDLRCVHLEGASAVRAEPDPAPRISTAQDRSVVPVFKTDMSKKCAEDPNDVMARAVSVAERSVAAIASAAAAPVGDLSAPESAPYISQPYRRPLSSPAEHSFAPQTGMTRISEDMQSSSSEASAPDFRIPCVQAPLLSSSRFKSEFTSSPLVKSRPSSDAQPLPRTTSVGDDGRGYSIAFSEASFGGFGSPRSVVDNSQRATRDFGDVDVFTAPIAATASAYNYTGSVEHGGGLRSSTDYKLLIAKADAMLGQFAAQSSGRHS